MLFYFFIIVDCVVLSFILKDTKCTRICYGIVFVAGSVPCTILILFSVAVMIGVINPYYPHCTNYYICDRKWKTLLPVNSIALGFCVFELLSLVRYHKAKVQKDSQQVSMQFLQESAGADTNVASNANTAV